MKKLLLLTLAVLSSVVNASEITQTYDKLFELSQSDRGYSLTSDNFAMHFPRHQVSKPIRDLRADQLAALLKSNAYYLKATELSDGTHSLDLQGRLPGAGWGSGAVAGWVVGKLLVPGAIILPITALTYATKAVIHIKAGPVNAAAFGESAETWFLPAVRDFAFKAGDACAPVAAVVGAISNPV